jgi:hypothetical protein
LGALVGFLPVCAGWCGLRADDGVQGKDEEKKEGEEDKMEVEAGKEKKEKEEEKDGDKMEAEDTEGEKKDGDKKKDAKVTLAVTVQGCGVGGVSVYRAETG